MNANTPAARTPLRTDQHILHLLLSVFTCGLWIPVWIILAARGNPPAQPPQPPVPYTDFRDLDRARREARRNVGS